MESTASSENCSEEISSSAEALAAMRAVRWGVPLLVTVSLCTCLTVLMFLHTWWGIRKNVPCESRRTFLVRLFALFPVYAVTSLAGIFIPKGSVIASWGASLYLASTLYTLVLLIVDYYGGIEQMGRHIEGVTVSLYTPPLCCFPCLPRINFTMTNFDRLRMLVLQTAYIRPLCVFLAAILWADGLYVQSAIGADSAFIYLSIISLVSSLTAVYGLSVIYNATHDHLQHFMITAKFSLAKAVLIMTNTQSLVIVVLVKVNVIPCNGPLSSAARGSLVNNMLVVFEMFLLSIAIKKYYHAWSVKHEYGRKVASATVNDLVDDHNKNSPGIATQENHSLDVSTNACQSNGSTDESLKNVIVV